VYRAVVLLNPGVLLVIDHIEKTEESPTRYVGAFFHNRNTPFVLQEDQYGDTLASIRLNDKHHLVLWTNPHQGQSTVQSQSTDHTAEAGTRKTHFLNITTNLNQRQTRIGYLFVAPGNKVTKPTLQSNEIGVKAFLEINDLPLLVSIATNFQKRREYLGFDGFAKVQVGNKSPIEFARKELHVPQSGRFKKQAVHPVYFSKISLISLFAWVVGFVVLLFLQGFRRPLLKCNQRICSAYFIGGMMLMWTLVIWL